MRTVFQYVMVCCMLFTNKHYYHYYYYYYDLVITDRPKAAISLR